jgi:sugar lactone lactonase YvrE
MKNTLQNLIGTSELAGVGACKLNLQSSTLHLQPSTRASKCLAILLAGAALGSNSAWAQLDYATPYTFITTAGTFGESGAQDGTNGAAQFGFPAAVALDSNDDQYVVDNYYYTVRKVTPVGTNWVVTTIAGTADVTGSLDGTNQTIEFNEPTSIARDLAGNLYVTDAGNNTVRKLTPQGTNWVSSTIAGTANYSGGSANGTNGAAQFYYPSGIAVDAAGNLYVADTYNDTIRRVAHVGANWVVTTIAGTVGSGLSTDGTNQAAQFYQPAGIAVDQSSNIFVADTGNYTIRKITPVGTNWVTTTIAGTSGIYGAADGTNGAAEFLSPFYDGPMGLAVDAGDDVYVADSGNGLIRKVSPVGTNWVTTTLAGNINLNTGADGTGTNAVFGAPWGIAVDAAGLLFVADAGGNDMREGSIAGVPNLTISQSAGNVITVSWPAGGFILQTNAVLGTANWGPYGGAVNTTNGTSNVTVSPAQGNLFFRLTN